MNGWDGRRIVTVIVVATLVMVAGVAVFRVPLQSFFVLGIALVCPLLMIGMHAGGHGHGASRNGSVQDQTELRPDSRKEVER